MDIDIGAIAGQLEEIGEWVEENEMGDVLQAQAELAAIVERISALHLRVVP